jgi:Flp pilus assembly protein TadG
MVRSKWSAQSLVEFAVVVPVILIMLLGMIDLGRAFVFGVAVQHGAREASRVATKAGLDTAVTDQQVLQRLIDASSPALVGCAAATTANQSCGGGVWTFSITYTPARQRGAEVRVTARGGVSLLVGLLLGSMNMGLNQISVQGEAVMQVV